MAFMMPVMKNEFDIYKSSRSRRTSECSNQSTCRSRKISECSRSDCPSLSTSPGTDYVGVAASPAHRSQPIHMQRTMSQPRAFSRASSRNSQSSLITSPTKSSASSSSPPKPSGSESNLAKFHTRLVDKLRKSLRRGKSSDARS